MCKYNTKASQVLYYKNLAGPETELQKECAREREKEGERECKLAMK